ncbi:G-type lectin S-receptor-like serine/threonine-protein kinase At1g11330 isoform X2 [Amaranthus tricolor]|uniref:G-type lectin S-receptor-like serine/threonine-protein kinase At1g11330 isoform X2 n=1 Tax=Amaranthus tricolor TaxID=29722 RepID=UPI0025908FB4|nr:G-type lectin S-receptor-like serine/threonine-protein kinase At1g11330 isoform X2 [Amaranthus tricolor]
MTIIRQSNSIKMVPVYAFILCIFIFQLGSQFCLAINSITPTHFLKDPEAIVSNNSLFKLGFFSPPNSKNRYVGIWYNHPTVMDVVWVANRNNPLLDSGGLLSLSADGNLKVSNARNETLWSSNVTYPAAYLSVAAQLLDSGNLVVQGSTSKDDPGNDTNIWQSFEHPTDTILPNMRFVFTQNFSSKSGPRAWNSSSDPSDGRFSIGTSSLGLFQVLIRDGDQLHWRSGPWNGNIFIGTRYHNTGNGNILVNTGSFSQEGAGGMLSVVFAGANETSMSHYALNYQGTMTQTWWDDRNKNWGLLWKAPDNDCDIYGKCGEFGSCSPNNPPICSCLKGFEPKNKEEWRRGNWTSGCVRRKQLQCNVTGSSKQDGFLRLQMMKVPDNAELYTGLGIDQCRNTCLTNCSCLAYAYDTQLTCLRWSRNLIDVADLSPTGIDLYLRLAQSELGTAVIAAIVWFLWRRSRSKSLLPSLSFMNTVKKKATQPFAFGDKNQAMIDELEMLKFEKLDEATDGFHERNLLGRGGFGQVYKGILEDGKEIAVKRLSRASGQGIEEFMNEVALISKLQHRNLVKLLGCCIEGEEKMLIYEYMPNKSLDAFLFDPEKGEHLDWQKRFNIIEGVCRGLLYLHRDSRLKIIHRDLKPSNILLDKDHNPKISDFGMARIFGGNKDQASTQRVVGTYGYMSPEYAMEGHFSEKSDVFSLGTLLIEMVTGKKNNNFWHHEDSLSLLGYAWKLWNENNVVSLIDPSISAVHLQADIVRCMQVGLLCVQEFAKDRPNVSTVISMLVRDIMDLPDPKQPRFSQRQIHSNTESSPTSEQTASTNYVTTTCLTAR